MGNVSPFLLDSFLPLSLVSLSLRFSHHTHSTSRPLFFLLPLLVPLVPPLTRSPYPFLAPSLRPMKIFFDWHTRARTDAGVGWHIVYATTAATDGAMTAVRRSWPGEMAVHGCHVRVAGWPSAGGQRVNPASPRPPEYRRGVPGGIRLTAPTDKTDRQTDWRATSEPTEAANNAVFDRARRGSEYAPTIVPV